MPSRGALKEVAALFLKLGVIAFGGPAAHIAIMQREVVEKRQWLTQQHFLDLLGATNLIPGPNSTEMALHIGQERAGWKGLLTAGVCFILPAVLITGIFAWLYKEYGHLPHVEPFIYGIKPAIIAIILVAIFPLAQRSLKTPVLWVIGLLVLAGTVLGVGELYLLFGAGLLALLINQFTWHGPGSRSNFIVMMILPFQEFPAVAVSNAKLFLIFLKIGSILYGSGYVLFAFLDGELVGRGLLSRSELMDAIAVGQFTPGPVFSAVTFVGYQINGFWGAVAATAGIFLPSFAFVALLNPMVSLMRNSRLFAIFLDAVNVASIAIIAGVCYAMAREAITDWRTIAIAGAAMISLLIFRNLNSALVVLGGSLAGYLLSGL
jgi:chromate transporter